MIRLDESLFVRLGKMPLRQRRPLLRSAWQVAAATGNAPTETVKPQLEHILRLPSREALRVAKSADYLDMLSMLEWAACHYQPRDEMIKDSDLVQVENEAAVQRLSGEQRPIIFAPIHAGAYIFSIVTLIYRHFRGRRILVLRNKTTEVDSIIIKRVTEIGSEVRFMFTQDKGSFVDALRYARRDAIIVCFVDLPASYGEPYDIELFGRPARIALGIEKLARACNAPILPIASRSHNLFESLVVRRPFEVGDDSARTRDRVAGLIRSHIEASVIEAPSQWHMWPRISEYLVEASDHNGIAA